MDPCGELGPELGQHHLGGAACSASEGPGAFKRISGLPAACGGPRARDEAPGTARQPRQRPPGTAAAEQASSTHSRGSTFSMDPRWQRRLTNNLPDEGRRKQDTHTLRSTTRHVPRRDPAARPGAVPPAARPPPRARVGKLHRPATGSTRPALSIATTSRPLAGGRWTEGC